MFSIAETDAAVAPVLTPLVRDLPTALERAQRAFERGHLREAIELLEQALVLDASHIAARTMLAVACAFAPRCTLGELYLRLGIPEQARPHLARALEVASNAAERAYVAGLLKEDRARERRRMPRPSFRAPFWLFRRARAKDEG